MLDPLILMLNVIYTAPMTDEELQSYLMDCRLNFYVRSFLGGLNGN